MAVKKTTKQNVEQVEETVEVAVEEPVVEEAVETEPVEEVQVEVPEAKKSDEEITIDTNAFKVDEVNIPKEKDRKVKIRMRVDHHCCIAMERYDLKAGKCYDVPANVKKILDKAGLLSPL